MGNYQTEGFAESGFHHLILVLAEAKRLQESDRDFCSICKLGFTSATLPQAQGEVLMPCLEDVLAMGLSFL